MKFICLALMLFLMSACQTMAPVPTGSKEKCGTQGRAKYCIYKFSDTPSCTLDYVHGLQEDQNAMRSTQYPHPDLPVIAKKLNCNVLIQSYGTSWMIGADKPPTLPPGPLAPSMSVVMADKAAIESKEKMSSNRFAMGVSMGGYNLAQMIMDNPAYYKKAVIIDPVMLNKDAGLASFLVFINFNFGTWFKWSPNLKIMTATSIPQTYLTACKTDEYVPFDGPNDFASKAKKKFPSLFTFHVDSAGCKHAAYDLDPVMNFYSL